MGHETMTNEENAEAFARIVAKSGTIYCHPDSFKNLPRSESGGLIWDSRAVTLISSPLFERDKIYAFAPLKEPVPFPWTDPDWPEPKIVRPSWRYSIVTPKSYGFLFTADAGGVQLLSLDARIRERKRIAKKRRRIEIKTANAGRSKWA